jgi:hypothetical protein
MVPLPADARPRVAAAVQFVEEEFHRPTVAWIAMQVLVGTHQPVGLPLLQPREPLLQGRFGGEFVAQRGVALEQMPELAGLAAASAAAAFNLQDLHPVSRERPGSPRDGRARDAAGR